MQISTQSTIPPLACKQLFAQTLCALESVENNFPANCKNRTVRV
jgi:hypothetical protein